MGVIITYFTKLHTIHLWESEITTKCRNKHNSRTSRNFLGPSNHRFILCFLETISPGKEYFSKTHLFIKNQSFQAVLAITVAIQMSRTKTVKEPRLTCDKKSCESCTETSIMSNIAGSVNLASYDMTQLVHQFTNSVENWMKIAGVTNNNQHVVSL